MPYQTTPEKALKDCKNRIDELCGMVNRYAVMLKLGKKVNAEDWSDIASEGLKALQKEPQAG